ncbi:type II toxin-antitoxin system RelE/ParE family toxin [Roseivirga sp.]|uniref:type II toxin-antitoxin system RelE/ParE family toxin n=1 Tax=Roseivirga sp. TaxID=1964215 RepID=UPI002B275A1E|nr:type II toxin-antitoxin system RelE/ParE family toxin [Roseivirga sp.]
MANYKLTKKAVEDISKIWAYTLETWSENQADKYYEMLISSFQEIANNPNSGKNYEGITPNLFGVKVNRHIVFYRIVNKNYIEIIRILHESMDLKKRITE